MKHAICIIGYGDKAEIVQKTINVLDDKDIAFFIHWDARYKLPSLKSKYSAISFVKNRIPVKWGGASQIQATLLLLRLVIKNNIYDYVHLISCNDIPLMTRSYFKNYFKADTYIGFNKKFTKKDVMLRIGYYYPNNVDFRKHKNIRRLYRFASSLLRINRLKKYPNISFKKGPQWFSIKTEYLNEILDFNNSIFMHGFCADELFIQMILNRFETQQINSKDDNAQALRYIDWHRGGPYVFTINDVDELKKNLNTNYAFARKVVDPEVIDRIFNLE